MGEYTEKISRLREDRKATATALGDIKNGALVLRDGVDVTVLRSRHLEEVLASLDALISSYEDLDTYRA